MTDKRPSVVLRLHRPPHEAQDDDALMALAAADHRRAFEILATRHLGDLTRFCAKYLGCARTGEEIAQDVLVEAWTRRRRYRAEGRLRVFLLTIARARCLNRLRDDRRRATRGPALVQARQAAESAGGDPLDALLARERERQVREALLHLPTRLRETLLLRFDQALGYAEIARTVGRSEATIRSRVFQGIKRLRAAVRSEEP